MEKLPSLKVQDARNLMLTTLGLAHSNPKKTTKSAVVEAIRVLGYLQLDTISVAARAHLHILYSRLGNYDTRWLEQLHEEGSLFEYFVHGMSLIPIEDFPVYWPLMMRNRERSLFGEWEQNRKGAMKEMKDYIRDHGAVKSSDFKGERTGPWWGWKEQKGLLEALFYCGDLMISKRESFQRVYDLRERVLPSFLPEEGLSLQESARIRYLKAAKSLGLATETWLSKQYYIVNQRPRIKELASEGKLLVGGVEGNKNPMYVHADNLPLYEKALKGELTATTTKVLSMFDPLMTDRDRVSELFGFDYRIQVYVPKEQRDKGYYVLPILHHGRLVGRLDVKALRKEKTLQVHWIKLEPGAKVCKSLVDGLAKELKTYAQWMGLDKMQIGACDPEFFGEKLLERLLT